jgi:hypothetical protein
MKMMTFFDCLLSLISEGKLRSGEKASFVAFLLQAFEDETL